MSKAGFWKKDWFLGLGVSLVLLVAMGAWFKSSMELNDKTNLKTALTNVENDLKRQLEGLESDRRQGLKFEVDDPQEGLQALDRYRPRAYQRLV